MTKLDLESFITKQERKLQAKIDAAALGRDPSLHYDGASKGWARDDITFHTELHNQFSPRRRPRPSSPYMRFVMTSHS